MLRAHLLIVFTLAALLGCAAHTATGPGAARPKYELSMKFGEMMKKVQPLLQDKKWDAALAEIDRVDEHKNLNPYEHAVLWTTRAIAHFQLNQGDAMIKDLEQAVALDAMPEIDQLATEYNLGQAYLTSERYSEAADTFAKWAQRSQDIKPSEYYVIASSFASAKRYEEGLPYAQKAVDGMTEPKEPWLQLLVQLHYELHQEPEVAKTLERLIKSFPKTEYWLQLAATYQAMKQPEKAATVLDQARAAGALNDEKDLVNLARLYLQAGSGDKCAAVLDQQIKAGKVAKTPDNLELEAMCYLQAKDADHAEAAMAQGGSESGNGDAYLELGRLEASKGEWTKARDALVHALQKGVRDPGDAHLLLGVVHYNTKRKDAAIAALGEAKKHPESAKCADEWLQRVKNGKAGSDPGCALRPQAKP